MDPCIKHCEQLLTLLERSDPARYCHSLFRCGTRCCALAIAAEAGIGGLRIAGFKSPWLPEKPNLMVDQVADIVFGDEAWDTVFGTEALNERLGLEDVGGPLCWRWHRYGKPVSDEEAEQAYCGADARAAAIAALRDHMARLKEMVS